MNINPLNWFKKKEKTPLPKNFALGRLNKHAKFSGISDDENKIVEIYRGGKLAEVRPFSDELIKALQDVDEIPFAWESFEEEPFEFEESMDFGVAEFRR
jgi:hypothetical protein